MPEQLQHQLKHIQLISSTEEPAGLTKQIASIGKLSRSELKDQWSKAGFGPPPNLPASLLRTLLAHRMQERRFGGLSASATRDLFRKANSSSNSPSASTQASPGTRLIREWNGQTIAVEVLEEGYRFGDQVWASLSQIARHVTGTQWSGPRFFGLTKNG